MKTSKPNRSPQLHKNKPIMGSLLPTQTAHYGLIYEQYFVYLTLAMLQLTPFRGCRKLLRFSVAAENTLQLVLYKRFDVVAARREVLPRVKVRRVFSHIFPDTRRHSKTQV